MILWLWSPEKRFFGAFWAFLGAASCLQEILTAELKHRQRLIRLRAERFSLPVLTALRSVYQPWTSKVARLLLSMKSAVCGGRRKGRRRIGVLRQIIIHEGQVVWKPERLPAFSWQSLCFAHRCSHKRLNILNRSLPRAVTAAWSPTAAAIAARRIATVAILGDCFASAKKGGTSTAG